MILDKTILLNWIVSYTRVMVTTSTLTKVGKKFRKRIPCVTTSNVVVRFCPFRKEHKTNNNRKQVLEVHD